MSEIQIVDMPEVDLISNDEAAQALREDLSSMGVYMINVMGSPGAGKTSLLLPTIEHCSEMYRIGAICADVDTDLDAKRISSRCSNVIQMHTAGSEPFVPAEGAREGLMYLINEEVNLVFLENVGGLFSPVVTDTGASMNVAVMSVPEGEDIPLKYSFIFMMCDAIVINKIDLSDACGFDLEQCTKNILSVNENASIFPLSSKTGEGMIEWKTWLIRRIWESL